MIRTSWRAAAGALMLVLSPVVVVAQRGNRANRPQGDAANGAERQLGQLLQRRLQLTDQQVTRMQEATGKFRDRRRTLGDEDMQTRKTMRDMICSGDTTHVAEMTKLLDQWHDISKRRLQLQEDEQKELATFLSPYQRAKYLGFEEQMGRIMDGFGRGGRGRGMMPPDGPPDGGGRGRGGRAGQRGGAPPDGAGARSRQGPPDACGTDGPQPPGF